MIYKKLAFTDAAPSMFAISNSFKIGIHFSILNKENDFEVGFCF